MSTLSVTDAFQIIIFTVVPILLILLYFNHWRIIFLSGFRNLKKKRLIENIPTSKIRSLAMGLVEIQGVVEPAQGKLVKIPFSHKKCVYYKYEIEDYQSSRGGDKWELIKSGEKGERFFIRDSTGMVLVDPLGSEVHIKQDFTVFSGVNRDPPKPIKTFLKTIGVNYKGVLGVNKTLRYTEYMLFPNDKLYVIGTAGPNPFIVEGASKESVDKIMIQKGNNEKVYYISDYSEKESLKKIGIDAVFEIIIGALFLFLAIPALWFVLKAIFS